MRWFKVDFTGVFFIEPHQSAEPCGHVYLIVSHVFYIREEFLKVSWFGMG